MKKFKKEWGNNFFFQRFGIKNEKFKKIKLINVRTFGNLKKSIFSNI